MPLEIACPQCQQRCRVADNLLGKKMRCPKCQRVFLAAPAGEAGPGEPDRASAFSGHSIPANSSEPLPQLVVPVEELETALLPPVKPFPVVRFTLVVKNDPEKKLQGTLQATLGADGLWLKVGTTEFLVPRGAYVQNDGNGRLTVPLENRDVVLEVTGSRLYPRRLARDLVAFLQEKLARLNASDYQMSWGLYIPAVLPLGIAAVGIAGQLGLGGLIGGALWGAGAGLLAGICLFIARREAWPAVIRILSCLFITGLGSVPLLALLLFNTIRPADSWQSFSPPDGRFHLDFPGVPRERSEPIPGTNAQIQGYALERPWHKDGYAVAFGEIAPGGGRRQPSADQRFDATQQGMLASKPNLKLLSARPISLDGFPGREFILSTPDGLTAVNRVYLVNNRLYVLTAEGENFSASTPGVVRFLDSFNLIDPRGLPSASEFPGLLAYWPLEDVAGSAQSIPGVRGKGGRFTGKEMVLSMPGDGTLYLPTSAPFTLCLWFRTSAENGTLFWSASEDGLSNLTLGLHKGKLFGGWTTAILSRPGQPAELYPIQTTALTDPCNDNRWHHVCLARSRNGSVFLAVDQNRLDPMFTTPLFFAPGNHAEVRTQRHQLGNAPPIPATAQFPGSGPFLGDIDEVCLLNHEVSPAERSVIQNKLDRVNPPLGKLEVPKTHVIPVLPEALRGRFRLTALSADGKTLATLGEEGSLQVWNFTTGESLGQFQLPRGQAQNLLFSGDGALIGCAIDGTLHLWNIADKVRLPHVFHGTSFALNADGKLLVAGQSEGGVKVFDVASGEGRSPLADVKDKIEQLQFSHDGFMVIMVASRKECSTLHLLDPFRMQVSPWYTLEGQEIRNVDLAIQQQELALVDQSSISVLKPRLKQTLFREKFVGSEPTVATWAPDGQIGAVADSAGNIRLWGGRNILAYFCDPSVKQGNSRPYLRFTPDGRTLLAHLGAEIRLYNVSFVVSGHLRPTPESMWDADQLPSAMVQVLAASPDGKMVATGSSTQGLAVWSVESLQRLLVRIPGPPGPVQQVAFSFDGNVLAAGDGQQISLYDLKTRRLRPKSLPGGFFAWAPDGKSIAAIQKETGAIQIFDTTTGESIGTLPTSIQPAEQLAFVADGRTLALVVQPRAGIPGEVQKRVILWDIPTQQIRSAFPEMTRTPNGPTVSFSPDGKTLVLAGYVVRLFDVESGRVRLDLGAVPAPRGKGPQAILATAFAPDGSLLAGLTESGHLVVWELEEGTRIHGPILAPGEALTGSCRLGFINGGKQVVSAVSNQMWYYSVPQARWPRPVQPRPVPTTEWPTKPQPNLPSALKQTVLDREKTLGLPLALSADGKLLAASSTPKQIRLWNTKTSEPGALLQGVAADLEKNTPEQDQPRTALIQRLLFAPDGKRLVVGTAYGTIEIWDVSAGKRLHVLTPPDGRIVNSVESLAFSANSQWLVSAHANQTVRVWNLETAKEQTPPAGLKVATKTVAITPDGKTVLAGLADGPKVMVLDVANGQQRMNLEGHEGEVTALLLTPDGRTAISASVDWSIRFWDLQTGKETRTLRKHCGTINALALSSDGGTLLSSSTDGTVRTWDVTKGKEVGVVEIPERGNVPILDADARLAVIRTPERTVALWDVSGKKPSAEKTNP